MHLQPGEVRSIALLAGAAILILFWSKEAVRLIRLVQEALENFSGRGPRPPMHPMPANDAQLLNQRRAKETGPTRYGLKRRA